jgi:hypothetical protein
MTLTQVALNTIGGLARPAHLDEAFGDAGNIKEKVSIPSLTIAGKKFTMKVDGEAKVLTKTDTDTGELVNLQFVNVVVLDMNPNRSRTFFAKEYTPGENQMPACYSSDGKVPDKEIAQPQAATCAACPKSVKGSKIRNGKEGYACDTKKRLAVWPEAMLRNAKLGIPPLQMVLPITSIWDKENTQNDAEGWFAWDNYVGDIRAKGVKHTAEIVTRIKFDNTEHPKLLFKAVRYLDDAKHAQFKEVSAVKEVAVYDKTGHATSDDVIKLLFGKICDPDAAITPEDTAKPAATAAPAKPVVEDDGFGGAGETATEQKKPEAAATKTEKPKREPKVSAAAPSKPAEPVAAAAPSDALAALAAEWDM